MKLEVYCDGASRGNPGPSASAFLAFDADSGKKFKSFKHFLGIATNNQAEYAAILMAHKWLASSQAKEHAISSVQFILDSELAVKQLNGIYKIKNPQIASFAAQIKEIQKKLSYPISFLHVKRSGNSLADGLANEALDEQMKK